MPPIKSSKPQTQVQTQGKAVRKLKLLLQRWWHQHSESAAGSREAFLNCALLFGAAKYLSQLENGPFKGRSTEYNFASAVIILEKLWQDSCKASDNPQVFHDLIKNSALQKEFLALTKNARAAAAFKSPLSPAFIYEAFSYDERRISKDLIQADRSLMDGRHLISFTQVYTPAWVVDHLLQNTLSQSIEKCIDLDSLKAVSLLDPAVGGGVFIVQALDKFVAAYKTFGLSAQEAVKSTLSCNLTGLDIDSMALRTAALSLILKAFASGLDLTQIEGLLPFTGLYLIQKDQHNDEQGFPLGSLCRELRKLPNHPLNRLYDVVVANPPYLGRKLLPRPLKEKLKRLYPGSASDLSQAFLTMALELTRPGGWVGFITQASFLHLANAKTLRQLLLTKHQIIEVVELGAGVFPMLPGEKANTALITICNSRPDRQTRGRYLSLTSAGDKSGKLKDLAPDENLLPLTGPRAPGQEEIFRLQADFLQYVDCAISYLRPQAVTRLRENLPTLADIALLKQGLATTNNARFLRYVWEIDASLLGKQYVPYVRGDGGERWWSALTTVVFWHDNGQAIKEAVNEAYPYLKGNFRWVVKNEDYYFRSGLTFSFVSRDRLSVRRLAAGAIFDVGSSAIFVHEKIEEGALLAYLNSGLATAIAHDLNPTINFQVGDLKKIVIPAFTSGEQNQLQELAQSCVKAKQKLFALSSPLSFFQPEKFLPPPVAISQENFEQACALYEQNAEAIVEWEDSIDEIVITAALRNSSLTGEDEEAIRHFADRPRPKSALTLPASRYIVASLLQAMLCYFCPGTGHAGIEEGSALPDPLIIVNFEQNETVTQLFKQLPVAIDSSFIDACIEDKSVALFCFEDLPRACDEIFLGQSPLAFITIDASTMLIVAYATLRHSKLIESTQLHSFGYVEKAMAARIIDLLNKVKNNESYRGKRPKELGRELNQLLAHSDSLSAGVL